MLLAGTEPGSSIVRIREEYQVLVLTTVLSQEKDGLSEACSGVTTFKLTTLPPLIQSRDGAGAGPEEAGQDLG